MAQLLWDNAGDGLWFADHMGRSAALSLCIEEQEDGSFIASYCPLDDSEYVELGNFDELKLAKKELELYCMGMECSSARRK